MKCKQKFTFLKNATKCGIRVRIFGEKMTKEENISFTKNNLINLIHGQVNLEGIEITLEQTRDILNNVNVTSIAPKDMCKLLCLQDGWNYLFDHISYKISMDFLKQLHKLISCADLSYLERGKIRNVDIRITGTQWKPDVPDSEKINEQLEELSEITDVIDRAISTGLYIMRTQMFRDGNKRIGMFLINKILIENGEGIFSIPIVLQEQWKRKLVDYYESNNDKDIKKFMHENCLKLKENLK